MIIDIDVEGFMVQGGDPTNTGKGGESVWGHPFIDEFHPDYNHGNLHSYVSYNLVHGYIHDLLIFKP